MAECSRKRVSENTVYFKSSWEEEYFFTEHDSAIKCLLCGKVLNHLKKYNLQRHYNAYHSRDHQHLTREERLAEVEKLKASLMEGETDVDDELSSEGAVRASFYAALEIAKSSRAFGDGDFVKKCLREAAEQLCPQHVEKFEAVSLSRQTIARRIKEMAGDVLYQLRQLSEKFIAFSLALDEITDISGTRQIAIFVRGVDNSLHVTEELLDLIPLKEHTSGEDVFICVQEIVENNNLDWHKLVSVATDGTPAMVMKENGFVGYLKKKVSDIGISSEISAIHCLIHGQNLCAENIELLNVMSVVVRVTNYIRSHGLKHIQFHTFLYELDVEYGELPYHTEVHWLSRGKLLDMFFNIREEIVRFMEMMKNPVPELRDNQWLMDLAFVSDLGDHLNTLNVSLQEKGKLIVELYDITQAFKMKLQLWIEQLRTENIYHFPKLKSLATDNINACKYINILENLLGEFKIRFEDVSNLEIDFNIFTTPFSIAIESVPPQLQLTLIDLRCDRMLQEKFLRVNTLLDFYKHLPQEKFPQLHYHAAKILSMFGSTYVCEQLFSNMKKTKSAHRTRITNYNLKCSLILNTCQSIAPNISHLLEQKRLQKSRRLSNTE